VLCLLSPSGSPVPLCNATFFLSKAPSFVIVRLLELFNTPKASFSTVHIPDSKFNSPTLSAPNQFFQRPDLPAWSSFLFTVFLMTGRVPFRSFFEAAGTTSEPVFGHPFVLYRLDSSLLFSPQTFSTPTS